MKTNIHWNGTRWIYTEICDRCGKSDEWECSSIPNTKRPDFCVNCIMEIFDIDLLYQGKFIKSNLMR